MVKLNIGVLQFNPRIGHLRENIELANDILRCHGYHVAFPLGLHSLLPNSLSNNSLDFSNGMNSNGSSTLAQVLDPIDGNNGATNDASHISSRTPLDILVLPELAFTGYNFKSSKEIKPYLEPTSAGITTDWARHVSKTLGCYVLVGYPEMCIHNSVKNRSNMDGSLTKDARHESTLVADDTQLLDGDTGKHSVNDTPETTTAGTADTLNQNPEDNYTIYNSAVMVAPSGEVVFNYRKSFLYSADEQWGCSESPDMKDGPDGADVFPLTGTIMVHRNHDYRTRRKAPLSKQPSAVSRNHNEADPVDIPLIKRLRTEADLDDPELIPLKVQVGICMDLNPYKFEAPFEKYEFASAAVRNDVSLVLCPMAWLHPDSPDMLKREDYDGQKEEALSTELGKVLSSNVKSYEEVLSDRLKLIHQKLTLEPDTPNKSTYMYWYYRMMPLLLEGKKNSIGFVTCNRSGIEDFTAYVGSSSIFEFDTINKSVGWYGSLGQGSEDLMVRTIDVDP